MLYHQRKRQCLRRLDQCFPTTVAEIDNNKGYTLTVLLNVDEDNLGDWMCVSIFE
jgi:hypothetical protein